jgi:hypothetical protein
MGVADGDSERVGGVGALQRGARQQAADHDADLHLVRPARADDRELHRLRPIFGDHEPGQRRHEQRDAAGIAELERRRRIGVDIGFLDGRLLWAVGGDEGGECLMQRAQAARHAVFAVGGHDAVRDMAQPVAFGLHHTPAGHAKSWVDT